MIMAPAISHRSDTATQTLCDGLFRLYPRARRLLRRSAGKQLFSITSISGRSSSVAGRIWMVLNAPFMNFSNGLLPPFETARQQESPRKYFSGSGVYRWESPLPKNSFHEVRSRIEISAGGTKKSRRNFFPQDFCNKPQQWTYFFLPFFDLPEVVISSAVNTPSPFLSFAVKAASALA